MKYKTLLQVSFAFILILLVSCKNEKVRFSELLQNKDLGLAYEFQSKYPKSAYNIDSLIRAIEYYKCIKSDSISGYRNFLTKHESGYYSDSVKIKLSELLWLEITGGKKFLDNDYKFYSDDLLDAYYKECPYSPHLSEIDAWRFKNKESGTFVDKRDGRSYKWTRVGNQIWMSERLRYQLNSKMYDDIYSRYTMAALQIASPEGWHIPTEKEWIIAFENITNKTFSQFAFIEGTPFFSEAITTEGMGWGFWCNEMPDKINLHTMKYISVNYSYGTYQCSFSGPQREDNLYFIFCIKNPENVNDYDSTQYVKDICGNLYKTIKIGGKLWMNNDLETIKFSNGDSIPTTNEHEFCLQGQPKYQWEAPFEGKLYTGYAIMDERNVCPTGWHVPSLEEYEETFQVLNEMAKNENKDYLRFVYNGFKPCSDYPNRYNESFGYYWTCNKYSILFPRSGGHTTDIISQSYGMSVRCVKD